MRTYYTSVPAKTADEAVSEIEKWHRASAANREIEVRQIVPFGQKALVVYVVYEQGKIQ